MGDSVVVVDYGSRFIKAGYAFNLPTEDEPRIMTPCAVTVDQDANSGAAPMDTGEQLVQRPVRRGKIEHWDQFESLMYYVLYELIPWELGNEGNILLCEPVLTSRPDREAMTQLMFEVFNVNGLFIQDQAVLALYSSNRTTGLVADVGHDKIDVTTVTDGLVNQSSVRRLEYGGEHLTQYMQRLMSNRQASQPSQSNTQANGHQTSAPSASTLSEEAAEALKELCARCSETESGFAPACAAAASAPTSYRLPDGQEVVVGDEGLRVAEALFAPGGAGLLAGGCFAHPSIAEAAVDSVACVMDAVGRKAVYENLLVVGGGSAIPGVSARFLADVRARAPASAAPASVPLPEYIPTVPRHAAWVGGAVLARVALPQNHFLAKADYEEAGPGAVHRRCT